MTDGEFPGLSEVIVRTLPESMARGMRELGIKYWTIELFETYCRLHNLEMDRLAQDFGPAVEALRLDEGEDD